jgi:F0F1-type ATP synthase epsilon subunit
MAEQNALANPLVNQPSLEESATAIHVIVRDRLKVIYETDATAVTTYNETGLFDVLPQHANFISIIEKSIVVHTVDGKKTTISIDNGLVKVKSNTIHFYVNLLAAK